MDKQLIRDRLLSQRKGLTEEFVEVRSHAIFERLIQLPVIQNAKTVLTYADFSNEVRTGELTGWLIYKEKDVSLPVVEGDDMYAVSYRGTLLRTNRYGIAEPSLNELKPVDPKTIDVVICPGVAFSKEKARIGFGRGYYDRYLEEAPQAVKIGLAYDFQVLATFPTDPQDIPMNMVVTPDYIID